MIKKPGTFSPDNTTDNVVQDFCDLIIEADRKELKEAVESLRGIIGDVNKGIADNKKLALKIFLINKLTGQMYHDDRAPNVSFRADTINNIFDSIYQSVEELEAETGRAGIAASIFYNAGYDCGKKFATKFFTPSHEDFAEDNELVSHIRKWCDFDSSVGWGKVSFNEAEHCIEVSHNFQAQKLSVNPDERQYSKDCNFFRGYITACLQVIAEDRNIQLECKYQGDSSQCPKCGSKTHICKLAIKNK